MFWSVLLFACWPFVVLLLKHILDFSWHWELSPLLRLLPMQVFTRGVLLHTGLFHWNLPNLGRTRLSSSHERLCCRCLVTKSCLILLRPHGLWSARPLCPCYFSGKNTGVGCHFLLQGTFLTQGSILNIM